MSSARRRGKRTLGSVDRAFAPTEGEIEVRHGAPRHPEKEAPASIDLQLGQRVMRGNGSEQGTVVEATEQEIKVKWDRGATSYFRRGAHGNVRSLP